MSVTTAPAPTASRVPLLATLGYAASAVAMAVGTFWDLTDNEDDKGNQFGPYLVCLGLAAVALAVVFGFVVRGAEHGRPGRRSAILGVVGVLSIVVFWAGLPLVLAAGAIATALADRDVTGRFGAGSRAGLGLAAVTIALAVLLAITG